MFISLERVTEGGREGGRRRWVRATSTIAHRWFVISQARGTWHDHDAQGGGQLCALQQEFQARDYRLRRLGEFIGHNQNKWGSLPQRSLGSFENTFLPCGHLDFESAVTAQNDEFKDSFHSSYSRLLNVETSPRTLYLASILSHTFVKYIRHKISCTQVKWSLHSRWIFIAAFTKLHVDGDEHWPRQWKWRQIRISAVLIRVNYWRCYICYVAKIWCWSLFFSL